MSRPARLLLASLFLVGHGATSRADRSTPGVLPAGAVSVRRCSAGGGGREPDEILILATGELSETAPDKPREVKRKRVVEPGELAPLVDALRTLTAERIPDDKLTGWPPGGFWYLEIKDKSGALRRISYAGIKDGIPYFRTNNDDAARLGDLWPPIAGKRVPPSMEVKVKDFLDELISGGRNGERDPAKAFHTLDPAGAAWDLKLLPGSSGGKMVQLTPKRTRVVDVTTLSRELDVQRPIGVLAGGVWRLGERSTHAALVEFRTGDIEVVLDMPQGTTGPLAPVTSSELSRIVLRLPAR